MASHRNATVGIERHSIGTRLRSGVGLLPDIAAFLHEHFGIFLTWLPNPNLVGRNFGEEKAALVCPHRPLGPLVESAGNFFEFGSRGDKLIERRVKPLDFLSSCSRKR